MINGLTEAIERSSLEARVHVMAELEHGLAHSTSTEVSAMIKVLIEALVTPDRPGLADDLRAACLTIFVRHHGVHRPGDLADSFWPVRYSEDAGLWAALAELVHAAAAQAWAQWLAFRAELEAMTEAAA